MYKYQLWLIALFFSSTSSSQELMWEKSGINWPEDIEYLQEKVVNTVPDFGQRVGNNTLNQAFDRLKSDIHMLDANSIFWEIQQILGCIGDEGAHAIPFQQSLSLKILPLKTYWFEDGLFVLDASDDYTNLIGEEITSINSYSIQEVFEGISKSLNADNDYYRRYIFPAYASLPSLLKAHQLGDAEDFITLTFASGIQKEIKAGDLAVYSKLERRLPNDEYFLMTESGHADENYWYEYLPGSSTMFVQFKRIANDEDGDSFGAFVATLEAEINSGKANKLIMDVRYGGGGNGFKLKRLTDLLKDSKTINKRGHLFVLVSRATRGTLLELTSILALNSKAILVGEPTGEGPNTVSDTKYIKLPNSGLSISLPKVFWPTSWTADQRNTIHPELAIHFSYQQYLTKNDPWIAACLDYTGRNEDEAIPANIMEGLKGSYRIDGKKVSIIEEDGKLFLIHKRKMKSFFELKTELHIQSPGILSTDLQDVFLHYDENHRPVRLRWKGIDLSFESAKNQS